MKQLLRPLLAAVLLSVVTDTSAQDPDFHIYLCFGQSNMEGYPGIPEEDKGPVDPRFQVLAAVDFPALGRLKGNWYPATPPLSRPSAGLSPADHFGRAMVAALPAGIRVGVVNVAVGGCKIELFDTATEAAYIASAPEWMKPALAAYGGSPYGRLVEMGRLARKAGVIKGILLHQGESNNGEADWPAKVKVVYENLLRDLGLEAADVPLLVGEMVPADQEGKCAGMNALIATLPTTIPTAHVVSAAGCPCHPDFLHFTPVGYRKLGARYAATMLPLLAQKSVPATSLSTQKPTALQK